MASTIFKYTTFTLIEREKPKTLLNFMGPILPKYFNIENSYSHFKIKDSRCVCGFTGEGNTLAIVNLEDGGYYLVDFSDRKSTLLCTANILELS